LLTSAAIVWWTNAQGEFVEEQPYWHEYTGQTWEEYRGSAWISALHPDDRAAIMADWTNAVAIGSTYFTQGRIWNAKFGCYRAFQTRGIPVRDDAGRIVEWLGALTDIQDTIDIKNLLERTENDLAASIQALRVSESQLRESEARFRTMANSAPVLLWMSDTDKRCTYVNEAWLEFTGRPLTSLIGDGWVDVIHPDDVEGLLGSFTPAFDQRLPFEIEYRLRRHDGEFRSMVAFGVPRRDSSGEFCGYAGSALDITERKEAEERSRQFAHMQRLALVGELSAAIAHELRQPLSAIRLHAQTIERLVRSPDPALGKVGEIATDIEKDASRADDVIDRIRRFVQRRDSARTTVEIESVVREAAGLVSEEAQKRRVEIELALSRGASRVACDRIQILQVLLNFILNGMDSMEGAREPRRLTLRTERRDGSVRVSVSDRGTGIGQEAMPKLFESFYTTKGGGMGLGLSIAKSIIDAHRGSIWAENNISGRGATFHFALPVASF
jgi:PAS domain S-box-containing protein